LVLRERERNEERKTTDERGGKGAQFIVNVFFEMRDGI